MVGERRLGRCRQAREHTFGRCLAAPARRLVPSQVLSSVSTTSPPSRSWVTPPGAALAGQPLPPRARHHLAERTDVNPARLPSSAPTKPTRYRVGDARAEPGRSVGVSAVAIPAPARRLCVSRRAGRRVRLSAGYRRHVPQFDLGAGVNASGGFQRWWQHASRCGLESPTELGDVSAVLRYAIGGHAESAPGRGSDRVGEFGERHGDPRRRRYVRAQFVVSTAKVLHGGVTGDDDLCCSVGA